MNNDRGGGHLTNKYCPTDNNIILSIFWMLGYFPLHVKTHFQHLICVVSQLVGHADWYHVYSTQLKATKNKIKTHVSLWSSRPIKISNMWYEIQISVTQVGNRVFHCPFVTTALDSWMSHRPLSLHCWSCGSSYCLTNPKKMVQLNVHSPYSLTCGIVECLTDQLLLNMCNKNIPASH